MTPSQRERTSATRLALLDATIDCLVEFGYAHVTTTGVAERAGLSRGAQIHHFPTKAALVAEAAVHLARHRIAGLRAEITAVPPGPARLERVLDLMWESQSGPQFQALVELWVAARTDPELRLQLASVERDVRVRLRDAFRTTFAGTDGTQLARSIEIALATMRGISLRYMVRGPDEVAEAQTWTQHRAALAELLMAAAATKRER